jgi:hypothetical protein
MLGLALWAGVAVAPALAGAKWTPVRVPVLLGPIRVVINGTDWQPEVKPFLLQDRGTIMVPLRELTTALGIPLRWDQATGTVYLGATDNSGGAAGPGGSASPASAPSYVWLEDLTVLRNIGPFYQQPRRNFMVAARPFSRGVAVELEAGEEAEVVVDLAGQYREAEVYLGIEDATCNSAGGAVVSFYADDRLIYTGPLLKPSQYPYLVSRQQLGSLDGVKRLRVHARWQKVGLGEYDRVVVVLARFRLFR